MRGKLLVIAALAATMASGLGACARQNGADTSESSAAPSASQGTADTSFATLGDIFASNYSDFISQYDETHYTCAFNVNGTCYRIVADLPKGMYESLSEAEFDDQTQVEDLLGPLAVAQQDIIAESVPSQENLYTLAGKRGADLTAEGFVFDKVDGNFLDFAASVCLPQTDEYIPLAVKIDNYGNLSIKRDTEMDTNGGGDQQEEEEI